MKAVNISCNIWLYQMHQQTSHSSSVYSIDSILRYISLLLSIMIILFLRLNHSECLEKCYVKSHKSLFNESHKHSCLHRVFAVFIRLSFFIFLSEFQKHTRYLYECEINVCWIDESRDLWYAKLYKKLSSCINISTVFKQILIIAEIKS
jgi:hypothetical protein